MYDARPENRLIRDREPSRLIEEDRLPIIRMLSPKEHASQLWGLLNQEVYSYLADKNVEHLADIIEIAQALASVSGMSDPDFKKLCLKRKMEYGGYRTGTFLIETRPARLG